MELNWNVKIGEFLEYSLHHIPLHAHERKLSL